MHVCHKWAREIDLPRIAVPVLLAVHKFRLSEVQPRYFETIAGSWGSHDSGSLLRLTQCKKSYLVSPTKALASGASPQRRCFQRHGCPCSESGFLCVHSYSAPCTCGNAGRMELPRVPQDCVITMQCRNSGVTVCDWTRCQLQEDAVASIAQLVRA